MPKDKRKGNRRSKQKSVGSKGRGEKGKTRTNETSESHKPRLVTAVVAVIVAGAIAALVYALVSVLSADPCKEILKSLSSGEVAEGADMHPFKIQVCRAGACEFDLSQCEVQCPLAFATDDKTGCPVSCDCANRGIYQGDISFDELDVDGILQKYGRRRQNDFALFFATSSRIWNQTIVEGRVKVPYEMDVSMGTRTIELWNEAVVMVSQRSCIDLILRTDEEDYLRLMKTVYCASRIGKSIGGQPLQLGSGCGFLSIILHELMHAFGFDHEQTRPDRDIHVTIHEENIVKFYLHNFDKREDHEVLDLGSEYDKKSGLHYRSDDFALPFKTSLTFKPDGRKFLTDAKDRMLTDEDYRELNLLYKCKQSPNVQGQWQDWASWSECSKSCKKGVQTRSRACHDSAGVQIGNCQGGTFEYRNCDKGPCPPASGTYEEWGEWGKCDKKCDLGKQYRYRNCPTKYKDGCEAPFGIHHYEETKACRLANCDGTPNKPVTAQWLDWQITMECNATCGGGFIEYLLSCSCDKKSLCHVYNCDPEYKAEELGAQKLYSNGYMKWEACNTHPCGSPKPQEPDPSQKPGLPSLPFVVTQAPIIATQAPIIATQAPIVATQAPTGSWSEWGPWGGCDKVCGDGNQVRVRSCKIAKCEGNYFEAKPCYNGPCHGISGASYPDATYRDTDYVHRVRKKKKLFDKPGQIIESMCTKGTLFAGKFNADKTEDFMCYNGREGVIQLHFSSSGRISEKVSWEGKAVLCSYVHETHIHVCDIDGDKMDDIVCRNPKNRNIEVFLNKGGRFQISPDWAGQQNFCQDPADVFNVHDMNGDGKGDLVCGDQGFPAKYVVYHVP